MGSFLPQENCVLRSNRRTRSHSFLNFCVLAAVSVSKSSPLCGSRVVFHWTLDRCPFEAIAIINLPTNLESEVTHRYTANSFKLHRLPTPRPGQVLGLVGTNGIGKSTALKILAGKLKPNLGRYDVRTVFYDCDLDFDDKYSIGSTWLGRNPQVF